MEAHQATQFKKFLGQFENNRREQAHLNTSNIAKHAAAFTSTTGAMLIEGKNAVSPKL